MRVGVDGRSLVAPGARGVARYTSTLIAALAGRFPDDEWCVLVPRTAPAPPIAGVRIVRAGLPSRVLYGSSGLLGRPRLDELLGGVDVFWAPAPAPLGLSADVPLVLSLFDLSWELRPSDFTRYERLWHRIARPRRLAARAARVIAVSEVTRELAIERWGLDPQRVTTVSAGLRTPDREVSPAQLAALRRVHALPQRYFLSVGALEPRKAPDVLVGAFRRARGAGLDAGLVVVGSGRLATTVAGPDVHVLGPVTDTELDALYAGALGLVMPSRLEGFGLPPLEAALRGVPSIVSDLRVFDETLGDAAIRVPVDGVSALAAAFIGLAADPTRRDRLGARARQRARRFTAEGAAAEVHAVLSGVVRGG